MSLPDWLTPAQRRLAEAATAQAAAEIERALAQIPGDDIPEYTESKTGAGVRFLSPTRAMARGMYQHLVRTRQEQQCHSPQDRSSATTSPSSPSDSHSLLF